MNSRATSRIAVAMITRAQMRPKPGSWRMASLATTPSDANISCTATSATCTEAGTGAPGERTDVRCSRLRDGIVVGIVGAAFDAVLLHQLAEVLAIDVGLTRGVRDVALVLLEQRQDVVALEGRHPALLGVLEGRLDVGGTDGDGRRRRRAGAARRLLLAAHLLRAVGLAVVWRLAEEVLDEQRQVLGALAQGRQEHAHHAQAIEQVLAEAAGAHLFLEVA